MACVPAHIMLYVIDKFMRENSDNAWVVWTVNNTKIPGHDICQNFFPDRSFWGQNFTQNSLIWNNGKLASKLGQLIILKFQT